jgi:hypothetical protein
LARIELPPGLVENIGPEMKMDCHWIDVRLMSGMAITNLVVRGGRYITGYAEASNGESELTFTTDEIRNVRRHVPLFATLWPFW